MTAAVEVHGTEAGYFRHRSVGETPCESCKTAHNADERARYARRLSQEQLPDLVDAGPARAQVLLLREAGWTWERIARRAGISTGTLHHLINGRVQRGRLTPPTQRMRQHKAEAILALAPRLRPVEDAVTVGGVL